MKFNDAYLTKTSHLYIKTFLCTRLYKMFKCQYCDKNFRCQANLTYHYTQKVCHKPDRTCPMCGYVFTTKRKCQIHVENKTCQNHPKVKVTLKSTTSNPKVDYKSLSQDELIERLTQMETKYQTLQENPQNVQNIQNNQIVVFPSEFGQETIQNIQEKLGDILTPLIKKGGSYIPILTDQIHCSKRMPEPCLS